MEQSKSSPHLEVCVVFEVLLVEEVVGWGIQAHSWADILSNTRNYLAAVICAEIVVVIGRHPIECSLGEWSFFGPVGSLLRGSICALVVRRIC